MDQPIYLHMRMELLEGDYLQVDATPIQYCDLDYGQRKGRKGWLCAYSGPEGNVCFKSSVSRALDLIKRKSANTRARIRRVLTILRRNCLRQSALFKACDYSLRIWEDLSTYLLHA